MLGFDPQALTSLTQAIQWGPGIRLFRSTGSYEPDQGDERMFCKSCCFDPQALTSLTPSAYFGQFHNLRFDPQALTSLTPGHDRLLKVCNMFRSTGSYEPDQGRGYGLEKSIQVSIHRLLRA